VLFKKSKGQIIKGLSRLKLGHILFKVNNLQEAVKNFSDKGFNVEYGSKRNPKNALIYFSEGAYIELLESAPISCFQKVLLVLIRRHQLVQRFASWESSPEGYFELCFEKQNIEFDREIKILKKHGISFFITSSQRVDPFNRRLKWKLLFPLENKLPFLMTPFNEDPRPKNFIHPNGVSKISQVIYGAEPTMISVIKMLCSDPVLFFSKDKGVLQVKFETNEGEKTLESFP
jgi:hypothetical protein